MKKKIFLLMFFTLNLYSQSKMDTISFLKRKFVDNVEEFKNQPLSLFFQNLPYEIKAYTIESCPPSDFKSSCAMPSYETLKTGKISFYLKDKIPENIAESLANALQGKIESSTDQDFQKIPKYIILTITLNDVDKHPYYKHPVLSEDKYGGNNWSNYVQRELSLSKYSIKEIELNNN
ncbi:hypothetical protein [Flavobacterium sp.]|uniref:hypothetical protein n=1 Tax=Flavobacterium sp. TaxID=239 RepID=UPI003C471AFA